MESVRPGDAPTVSETVLREVAAEEGVGPDELRPPLYDVVDPEALDRVFRERTGQVSFEYHGYVVTVDHEGSVSLQPAGSD